MTGRRELGIAVNNPIDLFLIYWFYARASNSGDPRYDSDPEEVEHGAHCHGQQTRGARCGRIN